MELFDSEVQHTVLLYQRNSLLNLHILSYKLTQLNWHRKIDVYIINTKWRPVYIDY